MKRTDQNETSRKECEFEARLSEAIEMPTNETVLVGRLQARLAEGHAAPPTLWLQRLTDHPAVAAACACSMAVVIGYAGAGLMIGGGETAMLALALGATDPVMLVAPPLAGGF